MKYRIYIDEVGNPDLESSDNPNHRFLSLTGVILELDYVGRVVHPELENVKRSYFAYHPDEPVVLHRRELVNGLPPFEALRDPRIRARFDSDLLDRLRTWDYTVISVCLDKKEHKERYTTWRYYPYHYCLAVLLERYSFFLNRRGTRGDVMAESRGGKADMRLKASFEGLWKEGTSQAKPETFQQALTSCQLKVKPKANNIAGLQLADLLAHPSRNEILQDEGLADVAGVRIAPFAAKIIAILQAKYDQLSGRTRGYGKKKLP